VVVAQDNIRGRLAAGTVNGLTGNKTPPAPAGAIPADTYIGGAKKLDVGGRTALLTHVNNAHTDGDTWVYFADANVLATGDIFTNGRYPNIDFANGGGVNGVINAVDAFLKVANDNTRIVPGHGPLASRSQIAEFRNVLRKAARNFAHAVAPRGPDRVANAPCALTSPLIQCAGRARATSAQRGRRARSISMAEETQAE
jgi:cyclase